MRCPRTEGPGGWRAVLEKVLELAWRFALASLKACSYKEFEILLRVGEQGI
jgi:hypothetical protein